MWSLLNSSKGDTSQGCLPAPSELVRGHGMRVPQPGRREPGTRAGTKPVPLARVRPRAETTSRDTPRRPAPPARPPAQPWCRQRPAPAGRPACPATTRGAGRAGQRPRAGAALVLPRSRGAARRGQGRAGAAAASPPRLAPGPEPEPPAGTCAAAAHPAARGKFAGKLRAPRPTHPARIRSAAGMRRRLLPPRRCRFSRFCFLTSSPCAGSGASPRPPGTKLGSGAAPLRSAPPDGRR